MLYLTTLFVQGQFNHHSR